MAEQKAPSALAKLNNTTIAVQNQIDTYCKEGKLNLPQDYSVGNAIKQAQLMIQDNQDLMNCTQASLAKCLLDMAVLGLNVSKSQCYFVPYSNRAQLSVSYMGKIAIAKRVDPTIKEIFARCVKQGEDFEFEDDVDGGTVITKHKRTIESLGSKAIIAAYATIVYNDGKPNKSLIMTFDRIKQSWKQSQLKPVNEDGSIKKNTTHDKFTEEMAQRTVINAICKNIVNTSSDADLFHETFASVGLNENAAQVKAEAKEKMNSGDLVDVDFTEVSDDQQHEEVAIHFDEETGEIFDNVVDK